MKIGFEGRYIPTGAMKIADKKSDAIAYLYMGGANNAAFCMRVFYGKQSKPVAAFQYPDADRRAKRVGEFFAARQAWAAAKEAQRAKDKETPRGVQVGQFLYASWGYDQTNVNFYKVIELVGKTMAVVAAVGQISVGGEGGASMTDKVIPAEEPAPGAKTYRIMLKGGRGTINGNYVSVWDGAPKYTSSYA